MRLGSDPRKWLTKKAKVGIRYYPAATVAFYGPDDRRASKVVVAILETRGGEPDLHKWFADDGDVRTGATFEEIVALLKARGVHNVGMVDGIFGCPHEEGKDYPDGATCPACPFWANRDRYEVLDRR